jgi:pyroglutamyl-peptidase
MVLPLETLETMDSTSYLPTLNILVTGFGPFLDIKSNPSWILTTRLPSSIAHRGVRINIITPPEPVPARYHDLLSLSATLIDQHKPDAILHIGLATNRTYYAIERSANQDGYNSYPDMSGKTISKAESKKLFASRPERLESDLDFDALLRSWKGGMPRAGKGKPEIDLRVSDDVGNYVCGLLYYASMAKMRRDARDDARVVFLHLPPLSTVAALEEGERVVMALVKALAEQCEV